MITTTALDALRFLFEASDVFAPVGKMQGLTVAALRARDKSKSWIWECASAAWCGKRASPQRGRRALGFAFASVRNAITITITTSNSNCISSHSGTSNTRTHPNATLVRAPKSILLGSRFFKCACAFIASI
jgi:hypothetical protein